MLEVKSDVGLTQAQVLTSRKKNGANVETSRDLTTFQLISKTIFSVFNIVMATLIILMLLVNEGSTAKFIGIVAAINTIIELVQQIRARLIIKKINKLTQKTVRVFRDGELKEVPLAELVIDDIIRLESGDKVPVDGEVISSEYAEFDESILTGESGYIEKKKGEIVNAGSFITAGSCNFRMLRLAKDSYLQKMTKQFAKKGISESPLQSQINQIIKALTYMTIFFIALIAAEGFVQENQKEEIIINAATLITSMVPQGLVLITTLSFAYGAIRIAKNQAVIQKLSAIEAMANTNVVCLDKTGTLTKNILEVKEIKWM